MARRAGEAIGRACRALDAIRTGDGGLLHAEPRKDHQRFARAGCFLVATKRVVMPQLGESVYEGTISKWLVKPGDKVVEFEPMLEVDTDKVSAEVPAPVTGILREILAKEGQTVQAGAEIAVVEVGGDGEAGGPKALAPARSSPPAGEVARSAGGATEPGQTDSRKAPPAEATPEAPTAAAKEAPTPRSSAPAGATAPEARE